MWPLYFITVASAIATAVVVVADFIRMLAVAAEDVTVVLLVVVGIYPALPARRKSNSA